MSSGQGKRPIKIVRGKEARTLMYWERRRADWRREIGLAYKLGVRIPPFLEWVKRVQAAGDQRAGLFLDYNGKPVRTVLMRLAFPAGQLQRLMAAGLQLGCSWMDVVREAADLWLERYDLIRSAALADDLLAEEMDARAMTGRNPTPCDWVGAYRLLRVAGTQDRYVRVAGREEMLERAAERAVANAGRNAALPVDQRPGEALWPQEYRWKGASAALVKHRRIIATWKQRTR